MGLQRLVHVEVGILICNTVHATFTETKVNRSLTRKSCYGKRHEAHRPQHNLSQDIGTPVLTGRGVPGYPSPGWLVPKSWSPGGNLPSPWQDLWQDWGTPMERIWEQGPGYPPPPPRDIGPETGVLPPRKDLGPESGVGNGNLTGTPHPPPPGVEQT